MHCSKIGHTYEAFTYLFGRNVFIRLLSANKTSADLLKLAITGYFRLIRDSGTQAYPFFPKLVVLKAQRGFGQGCPNWPQYSYRRSLCLGNRNELVDHQN